MCIFQLVNKHIFLFILLFINEETPSHGCLEKKMYA